MSYLDEISRLANQVALLQDTRMAEARERDQLRAEVRKLRVDNARLRDEAFKRSALSSPERAENNEQERQ